MTKILLIEDDPLMVRLYQKAFSAEGYKVEAAFDGEEGLKKVEEGKPSLILLDIMMPKMHGFTVLDKLRARGKAEKIPVVVLTNLAGKEDAKTALSKGAVKYIIKSEHTPKEVVDMVKDVLAGYRKGKVPRAKK